ncbi:unnamed protein product [Penicillium salamii]|uniref:Uncharacterized protein n=1 Tax=Penicillium salamii TaxID=1612424 RepID=A0A9W4N2J7_9EURO|nr:unnamed protein product [Penicillium salamii]
MSLYFPESYDGKQKQSLSSHGTAEMGNLMLARPKVVRGQIPLKPADFAKHLSYNMLYHSAGLGPTHAPRARPPRQQRWKNPNKKPITEWANAPKGWNPSEPDLDDRDIDAQIERCYERIKDNILPDLFQKRLDRYLGYRAARQKIEDAAPKGHDFEVAQRLHHLSGIQNMLQTEGDPDGQLPNVRALLKAFRAGELKVERGMVTYWSNGVRLNEPTKFNRELHERMLRENDSTHSFWVEGFDIYLTTDSEPEDLESVKLTVIHDTGADLMGIPEDQYKELEKMPKKPTVYGYSMMQAAGGMTFYSKVVEVELIMPVPFLNDTWMCPWIKCPAAVVQNQEGSSVPGMALSGPFPRFQFYTATCPDGLGLLYLCSYKDDLTAVIPDLPHGYQTEIPPTGPLQPPSPGGGPPRYIAPASSPGAGSKQPQVVLSLAGKSATQPSKRGRGRGRSRGRGRGRATGRG